MSSSVRKGWFIGGQTPALPLMFHSSENFITFGQMILSNSLKLMFRKKLKVSTKNLPMVETSLKLKIFMVPS